MATKEAASWPVWALISQARFRADLDIDTLAERSGVSREVIEAIESANLAPTTDIMFRLVEACGFELRLVVSEPDQQRLAHLAAHASRTVTERLNANQAGMESVAALRSARIVTSG
jgi:ribosome-binding protein aMBF1 (putative translation factor)